MTTVEFSNGFDVLLDSYRRFKAFDKQEALDSIEFNEYEKSVYLTLAQNALVVALYSGRNAYGEPFEGTEELRRSLDSLVKTVEPEQTTGTGVSSGSVFYTLPSDLLFIIHEGATFDDAKLCGLNGSAARIVPVTHDDYDRTEPNPFRGPSKRRILRLDSGGKTVELVSDYTFKDYTVRYLSKPAPIVLEDLSDEGVTVDGVSVVSECALDSRLHDLILQDALRLALASKGVRAEANNR